MAQIQRNSRRPRAAMRSSRLPAVKQLHDFHFTFQPSLRRDQMENLHELGFVERRENVIFLGPPGVGKTHLAISLAIAAAQSGENAVFDQWWRSWFGAASQICAPAEEASMPGMLEPGRIDALRGMPGKAFDAQFVALMTVHHVGAIRMADAAMAEASDLRLRIMAQAIRHGQRGEIALMHGVEGPEAVRVALGNLVLPAGDAAPDRAAADRPAP